MKRVLLINPWIVDFTAYDLWSKPLGLLYLADFLDKNEVAIDFLDCMDRRSPLLSQAPKLSRWNTGHYHREIIEKPSALHHIPRYFARYGTPYENVETYISGIEKPDMIGITSGMTYWYKGVEEMVRLCRKYFPDVPIVLGGVYATLLPDHARTVINPDHIIRGQLNKTHVDLLGTILGISLNSISLESLRPLWRLYNHLDYLVLNASTGCPYHCDFCASQLISGHFTRRLFGVVVNELMDSLEENTLNDVAFYDDALLVHPEQFIKPFLQKIIDQNLQLRLHTPNGVHSKMIDTELAKLMKEGGFTSLRLSFESASPAQKKRIDNKVTRSEFFRAWENLMKAGFSPQNIRVYLMAGLPGQNWDEVLQSVEIVHKTSAPVSLNAWSPIPGTVDYALAIEKGLWNETNDPLLGNPTCLPNLPEGVSYDDYVELMTQIKIINTTFDNSYKFKN